MNTKQKLTLGIAAIFMVTLTIVGVTYAYFVTRVTGGDTKITATTATLGDVKYYAGNGDSDIVSITDVLPGESVYKTFSVKNENTDTNASASYFTIYTTNSVTDGKGEFIHTADGLNTSETVKSTCYGLNASAGLAGTATENLDTEDSYEQPKMSTEEGHSDLCFVPATDSEGAVQTSIYNNIKLTLWQVSADGITSYATAYKSADGAVDPTADNIITTYALNGGEDDKNTADDLLTDKLTYNASNNLTNSISINPTDTYYYVLKVEYVDAGMNQNAENLAGLDVLVSIKA